MGTPEYDQGYLVALDDDDQIYIAGQSNGTYANVTFNVYGTPNSGQFVHIYEPDISASNTSHNIRLPDQGEIDISLTASQCRFL